MQAQVREWGNSQGIRLSKDILKSAGIALNEMLEVTVSDGVITLAKTFRHKSLLTTNTGGFIFSTLIMSP